MRAAVMRGGTLGALAALALAATARADCFDWSDGQAVVEQGVLAGLPPGALRWRVGRMPAHGAHIWTAIELRWTQPGGRVLTQRIFEGMQDGRVLIDRQGSALRLRVTSCSRDADHCRDVPLTYAWDRAAGRFAGATPAARQMLESACAAEEPAR
jgi:hypothetical protein